MEASIHVMSDDVAITTDTLISGPDDRNPAVTVDLTEDGSRVVIFIYDAHQAERLLAAVSDARRTLSHHAQGLAERGITKAGDPAWDKLVADARKGGAS